MKILLTNDDGIDAVGLETLRQAALTLPSVSQVVVVAPHVEHSGISHQVTVERPLAVTQLGENRFAVDGTPADCVRLGLTELVKEVDWVFAGVNDGANLGVDIHMSGTVAAAREAALMGKSAVAWSQYVCRPEPIDWSATQDMVQQIWSRLEKHGLGKQAFWNVNFPHRPSGVPTAALCSPEPQPLPVQYHRSNEGFQYLGQYAERPRSPGRDVDVCFSGAVAISKISADRH